jgi:hypothetical protein
MTENTDTYNQQLEKENQTMIHILLKEYEGIKEDMRFHLDTVFKLMTGWLTIFSLTVLGVFNTYNSTELGSVIIVLIGMLMLIGIEYLYLTKEDNFQTLSGYKSKIECDINRLCKKDLLIWDAKLIERLHFPIISIRIFLILYGIIPVIIISALCFYIIPNMPKGLITYAWMRGLQGLCFFELFCHIIVGCLAAHLIPKKHLEGYNVAVSQSDWIHGKSFSDPLVLAKLQTVPPDSGRTEPEGSGKA